MHKSLFAALLACVAISATAGTVYRPMPISPAPPCMISAGGEFLNANMIISVSIGEDSEALPSDGFFSMPKWKKVPAVVVQIPSRYIYIKLADLPAELQRILKQINDCKK